MDKQCAYFRPIYGEGGCHHRLACNALVCMMWNEIFHQALIAVGVLSETLDQYFWSSGSHCGAPDVIPASMVELRQCSTTSWVTAMPKPQWQLCRWEQYGQWELLHLLVWALEMLIFLSLEQDQDHSEKHMERYRIAGTNNMIIHIYLNIYYTYFDV